MSENVQPSDSSGLIDLRIASKYALILSTYAIYEKNVMNKTIWRLLKINFFETVC